VTWAVDVAVMPVLSFILDGGGVDGNTSGLLLWRLVDVCIVLEGRGSFLREVLGDGCGQGGLAVINMA